MKNMRVRDLMVPLSEYATVSQDATLSEAVAALRQAQANYDQSKYRHRAILIYGENRQIVGKVSFQAVLRGLEPNYDDMLSDTGPLHMGFTRKFQKAMIEQLKLWQAPLDELCKKAAQVKVKTFMVTLRREETVMADATLDEAIHYLVLGHHQSLLVSDGKTIVGVLRLTDVFEVVADAITACER